MGQVYHVNQKKREFLAVGDFEAKGETLLNARKESHTYYKNG